MEGNADDTLIEFVEPARQPPELLARQRRMFTALRWVLRLAGGAVVIVIILLSLGLINGESRPNWYVLPAAPTLIGLLCCLERARFCPECHAMYGLPVWKPMPAFCSNCQRLLDPARVLLDPPGVLDLTNERYRANSEPVMKLIAMVILLGLKDRSTEIRFEPGREDFRLSYRCDGVLYDMVPPPQFLHRALSGTLKAMAGLHPEQRPQTGPLRIMTHDAVIVADVETRPTAFGERVIVWLAGSENSRAGSASVLEHFIREYER